MNNTKQLIQKLKSTKNIKNIRLASSISKIENGYTFGAKEARKKEKNNKKLYKLLLKMYPKEVRERLEEIDKCMFAIIDFIERRTGWRYTSKGFIYMDNFQNMEDDEFRTFNTYRIPRDEKGFYLNHDEQDEYIKVKERTFFILYENMLEVLHGYIKEKEKLIKESVSLTKDPELAESLVIFLGYKEEEKSSKKTK